MEENSQNPSPQPLINPVLKSFLQIISVTGLFIIISTLFEALGMFIATNFFEVKIQPDFRYQDYSTLDEVGIMGYKIAQLLSSLGSFVLTAFLYVRLFMREDVKQLWGYKNIMPPTKTFGWVVLISISAIPVISYIVYLNNMIPLPTAWEETAQLLQKRNEELSRVFLKAPHVGILLLNLIVIAVVPAIGEELLFRGVYMQLFYRFFKQNIHLSVGFTAFLFSLMHLQFYNFFAILLMGILFGYMYYWSGSITTSIWAHFINNGLVVVFSFIAEQHPNLTFLEYEYNYSLPVALVSAVVLIFATWQFYKTTQQYHPTIVEEDEE